MSVTNTNFPLSLSSTITKSTLYSSAIQILWIVMKWGKLTTPPGFATAATGSIDTSEDSSTIEYQGTVYDILSAKITAPSHNTWILPDTNTDSNTLDLFITFQSRDPASTTKYIFVVLPLLSKVGAEEPPYLSGLIGRKVKDKNNKNHLVNSTNTNPVPGPFSLEDILPLAGNRHYAYYSTSFNITSSNLTTSGLTLVFYNGIHVHPDTLINLGTSFPAFTLPTDLTPGEAGTITSATAFPSVAGVSTYTTPLEKRTDLTKAYNCVPLDPDTDIVDGKIEFDATSSEIVPLKRIIDERDAARTYELRSNLVVEPDGSFKVKARNSDGTINKEASVTQVIAVFLGILLALITIVFLIFLIGWWRGMTTFDYSLYSLPMYVVFALFGGYLFGAFYHA